jgi:hypothetical protein
LKRECQTKIAVGLKECSPKASWSISRVLVADLPSFTQNLIQKHYSILPSITDKMKQGVKSTRVKAMLVHSAVSRGRLMH